MMLLYIKSCFCLKHFVPLSYLVQQKKGGEQSKDKRQPGQM